MQIKNVFSNVLTSLLERFLKLFSPRSIEISDDDKSKLYLILKQIECYKNSTVDRTMLAQLKTLCKELKTVPLTWKLRFFNYWMDLEEIHAVAVARDTNTPTICFSDSEIESILSIVKKIETLIVHLFQPQINQNRA